MVPVKHIISEFGPALGNGNLFETVVDSLNDELMVIAPDFHVLFANQPLLGRLGKSRQDVVNDFCYHVLHGYEVPCQLSEHECPLRTVFKTGKPVAVTYKYLTDHTDNKNEKYVSITASPILDKYGKVTAVTELRRNVTEAKLMEIRMAETYRDLLALGTISSVVSESLNLNTVLENALDKLLEIIKTDIGGILLFDEEKQRLCYEVSRGFHSNYATTVCYPPDEDIIGRVFQSGEIFITENARNDSRTFNSSLVAAEGIESLLIAPLRAKGKTLGVVNIASRTPRKFTPEHINFLLSAVPQIALAVENAKLHQEVEYKEQVRGELLKEIFTIQEEERRRIARELHDETSQALAGLAASLEVPLMMKKEDLSKIKAEIKKAQYLGSKNTKTILLEDVIKRI